MWAAPTKEAASVCTLFGESDNNIWLQITASDASYYVKSTTLSPSGLFPTANIQ